MRVFKTRSSKRSAAVRGNWPTLSIRARLIVVALLAIAPLIIERVHGLESARAERSQRAFAEVSELAQRGADSQRDIVDSMHALLKTYARLAENMSPTQSSCNRTLSDLIVNVPSIRGLAIAGTDGRIQCATDPRARGLDVSDRAYFQDAMLSNDFQLSDYIINRVRQAPGLMATYPIVNAAGAPTGVVIAAINLQWIGELAAAAAEREGASVLLIDGSGTLITGSADEAALIGKNFADNALVKTMLAHEDGVTAARGFDGVPGFFGYVRVPWTQARLAVGLDERIVHSGIDRAISIAFLQLAAVGLLVLIATWFGGERLIVKPIRSLARTAARIGRGDLDARVGDQAWFAEFEPLAAAFDDMARKLAAREEDLRIANQHLDELASLDGLTGLANRRGFDRRLDWEWQRAVKDSEPIALMMIDIDHFKLFNDRYGHVAGDNCLCAVTEALSVVTLADAVLVARYGGEEFALLLPGLDDARASALAETGRQAVEKLAIAHADAPCGHVTVSIGVASLTPREGQCAADLVEAADSALYAAKRCGRNTIVAHVPAQLMLAAS
jgi:diguanylate cyclase (GGDEF)-like protein